MGLQKILTSVVLVTGLALVGGAAFIGLKQAPADDAAEPDAAVAQIVETELLVDPVEAEVPDPIDTANVEAVWRNWMAENNVTQSSLAIGRDGIILHSTGQKRSPETAYAMASLSKAATGMCLNQLLMQSPYSWDSTLADLAPEFAKMNFTPAIKMADLTPDTDCNAHQRVARRIEIWKRVDHINKP